MGQVSFRDAPENFWAKVAVGRVEECWPWIGTRSTNGYGRAGKGEYAHRLAFELAHGARPPAGLDVCHSCDNRVCCNPSHLFLGTRRDNMQDSLRKGRHYSPFTRAERERHGFAAGGPCTP